MFREKEQTSELIVRFIKEKYAAFKRADPDKDFILIDNEDNIITELSYDGPLIEFKMLANDGAEYIKLRSPNDISVKIKPVNRH